MSTQNHPTFSKNIYFKFPWLNGSADLLFDLIPSLSSDPDSSTLSQMVVHLFHEFPTLYDRICDFFENLMLASEQFSTPTNDLENLALYPILQILISVLGNRIISNGFCNLYAKHCQFELKKPNSKKEFPDYVLEKICENVGIHCQFLRTKKVIGRIQYPFRMKLDSFLNSASKLKEDRWKLINHHFVEGQIYLLRDDVIYLLREEIRKKVRPDFKQVDDSLRLQMESIPDMKKIFEYIAEIISKNADRFNSSLMGDDEKIGSDLFAPCIRAILYKVSQGENLTHNERLAIAFYYLNTNHSIEETVDIFRTSPDFDEKIARYQVEFAGGSGGKGKKYSMYSCAKLKSLHLCYADDPKIGDKLCVQGFKKRNGEILLIHNPAGDYIFFKKVRLKQIHRSQLYAAEKNMVNKEKDPTEQKHSETQKTQEIQETQQTQEKQALTKQKFDSKEKT